jgi:glycosyltransferase
LNKLITIITATYNSSTNLENCIRSVLSQTYKEIEYIIIDNCSTDGTLDIAKSYSDEINRIISEPDKGIFDALNKGIKIASGEVIAFLHADDFYSNPQVIEQVMLKFETTGVDSVYGDLQYVSKNNPEKIIRNWKAGEYSPKKLLNGWMPPHPAFFVKRKCYSAFGIFNTDYHISADYDIILRFFGKCKITSAYIPDVLVKMRVGGTSNRSIKNIIRKSAEDLKAIKQNGTGNFSTLILKNFRKIGQFL